MYRIVSEIKIGECRILDSLESVYSPTPTPTPLPNNTDLRDSHALILYGLGHVSTVPPWLRHCEEALQARSVIRPNITAVK